MLWSHSRYSRVKARLFGDVNRQNKAAYGDASTPTMATTRELNTVDDIAHMILQPLLTRQLYDMYPEYRPFVNPDGTIIVRLLRAL